MRTRTLILVVMLALASFLSVAPQGWAAAVSKAPSTAATATADRVAFLKKLRGMGLGPSIIVTTGVGVTVNEVKIFVTNGWHYQPYQLRYQVAQSLWLCWANIHTPHDLDRSRISVRDLNGNEVGGSRWLAGSLVWVEKD